MTMYAPKLPAMIKVSEDSMNDLTIRLDNLLHDRRP